MQAIVISAEEKLKRITDEAFEQLGLLEWQRTPFRLRMLPVRKIDPESSPAVRYMQSLTAAGPRS